MIFRFKNIFNIRWMKIMKNDGFSKGINSKRFDPFRVVGMVMGSLCPWVSPMASSLANFYHKIVQIG
jgi:hypothetical protein